MSLWEIAFAALGLVVGALLSKLKRPAIKRERTTLQSPGVQPAVTTPRIIERQDALHDEHAALAHEDAIKQASEAKPKGDIKGAVDELF